MKKVTLIFTLSLTILTFLFSIDVCAQNNYNKTDNKGRRQGVWVDYHSNGQIRYKGEFKNNEPIGDFLYYSEDGKLFTVNKYSKNSDIVMSEVYSPEGRVVAKGNYINKKKQDKWEYFSEEDGSLILIENYNDGKLSGMSIAYLPGGNNVVIEQTEYINGVRNGLYSRYYDNGVHMIEANYNNDKLNGKYIHYYPNGAVKEEGAFENGTKIGDWTIYDVEGNVLSTEKYLDVSDDYEDFE